MRSALLLLSTGAAYAFLRGWPESWHPVLRICLAGILILAGLGIWGRSEPSSSPRATPLRQPRWIDYLTIVIAVLAIECAFLVFLTTAPEKAKQLAETLDEKLHPESYRNGGTSNGPGNKPGQGDTLTTSGNWLFSGNGSRTLQKGTKVRPSNKPEVYLWPVTPKDGALLRNQALYLRSFTLASYQEATWSPLNQTPKTFTAENDRVTLDPQSYPKETIEYEVSHYPNIGTQSLAVTLPHLLSIEQPFVRQTNPATFRLPPLTNDRKSHRYRATSAPRNFDTLPSELELSPDFNVDSAYLALPSDEFVHDALLAISDSATGDLRERLSYIRSYLAENHRYTLEPANPDNIDPLTNFLTGSREGYCDHFSTATTLLVRTLGIPSRVAYGWSGGRYFSSRDMFVFRAREAHAWAEIHLADFGWVTFETTPPTREEASPSLAEDGELPPSSLDLDFEDEEDDDGALAYFKPIALGFGGFTLLILLALLILRRPASTSDVSHPAAALLPRSPGYLDTFRRVSSLAGYPMPSGRTLRQHLTGLAKKQQAPEVANDLLAYHYSITYGDQPRNKAIEKKLITQLKAWERRMASEKTA